VHPTPPAVTPVTQPPQTVPNHPLTMLTPSSTQHVVQQPPLVTYQPTEKQLDVAGLFLKYKTIGQEEDGNQENCITVSGLVSLAGDLGVDAEDVVMLVLLYKIGSTKQYVVSETEWTTGWNKLSCTNLAQMKAKLPSLRKELESKSTFRPIYLFAFDYNRNPDQKSFANEDAIAAWRLLFTGRYGDVEKWCSFIQDVFKKAVPRDTWQQFFDFAMDVGTDLGRYSDSDAWPVIIDDYVEYLRKHK
jgi:DCN1-like protein 1/2